MDLQILQQLGIAAILASLIGIEREKSFQKNQTEMIFGGIRTFILISLMGALGFILSKYSIALFSIISAGFLVLICASYILITYKSGLAGATSEIAAILVYMIGILCAMDQYVLATTLTLFIAALLQFRDPIHSWVSKIKENEILSTIEFILIGFVVLPLLPNEWIGPYEFFNPYVIWLMVVFISGLSFISYIAIKTLGTKRGISITGFLGGLLSSTALVLSFSAQSKKNKEIVNPFVLAVIIASSAMFFRVLVAVAVLNRELLYAIIFPMLAMGLTGFIAVSYLFFRKPKDAMEQEEISGELANLENPFSLWPALKFGAVFGMVLFLTKFAEKYFGDTGLYVTSFIASITDVDAITVSVSTLAKTQISHFSAVVALFIAVMTNTISKGVMFLLFGERKVAIKILKIFGLMLVVGVISLFILFSY